MVVWDFTCPPQKKELTPRLLLWPIKRSCQEKSGTRNRHGPPSRSLSIFRLTIEICNDHDLAGTLCFTLMAKVRERISL